MTEFTKESLELAREEYLFRYVTEKIKDIQDLIINANSTNCRSVWVFFDKKDNTKAIAKVLEHYEAHSFINVGGTSNSVCRGQFGIEIEFSW
jgi:uncharacterized protein YecE (DUF72 family)